MKSNKLQDALGMIEPDLILRAEKHGKKSKTKRFIRWTAPIAAILVIALAIGIVFGSGSPFILTTYAIAEAELYREMRLQGTPTVQFYRNGELTTKFTGLREYEEIEFLIDRTMAGK